MTAATRHATRAGAHPAPVEDEPLVAPIDVDAASDYDVLPYPSMPITHTQPAHLAALAALFGAAAPAVERARVLELGCAAGGNIVPLAARFPHASFAGIDLSERHIADGRARIAALGLENIRLQQGDLATLDLAGEQFDYVICHGVFSWVPKATQDAIFRLCRDVLVPNGVVTISYNVLPGWHLRMAIRDLCLHYAGREGTPQRRVARARAALEQIAEASEESEPYGRLMRTEARRLKQVPAAYILGEFLAPDNTPCHVRDFIGQAANHGLDYLCEADLFAAVPQTLDPAMRGRITAFADSDRAATEQHIDFLTGRLFRRSVLVRQQPTACLQRIPGPDRLSALHIASPICLDRAESTDRLVTFRDARERPIATGDPVIREAFERLARAYPATLPLDALTDLPDGAPHVAAEIEARVRRAIFTMVLAGRASISVLPLRVGHADHEHPTAWRVARAEAASGQPWVTTLGHAGVPAHPILRVLLPLLDGTHGRSALRARLADALQSGAVRVPELPADRPPPSRERLGAIIEQYLDQILRHLERHAVLEPGPAWAGTAGQLVAKNPHCDSSREDRGPITDY
jgi:SAM-dependent methyltransferase